MFQIPGRKLLNAHFSSAPNRSSMASPSPPSSNKEEWVGARDTVAKAYAAVTHDVFAACNDPNTPEGSFGPGQHVYGEITDTERLCELLGVGADDVLCDLGSGRGQLVLEAAAWGRCRRAVGVEFVPARAVLAAAALAKMSSQAGEGAFLQQFRPPHFQHSQPT